MKIAELTAFHVRLPLRRTIRHALHRRRETENLLVRCTLADGTTGWGEGVPRDYVTSETVESALALRRAGGGVHLRRDDGAGRSGDPPERRARRRPR